MNGQMKADFFELALDGLSPPVEIVMHSNNL
jgi:hypothetical protein